MKFATDRPFADPDKAARKLLELANAAEADRDQRIAIELINLPFLRAGGSADEYRAGSSAGSRRDCCSGMSGHEEAMTCGRHCNWRGPGSRKRLMRGRADTGPIRVD